MFILVSKFLPKVSRRITTADIPFLSRDIPCKIWGWWSDRETCFSTSTFLFRVSIMMPILRNHPHHTTILFKEHTEQSLETCKHKSCFRSEGAVREEMLWLWRVVVLKSALSTTSDVGIKWVVLVSDNFTLETYRTDSEITSTRMSKLKTESWMWDPHIITVKQLVHLGTGVLGFRVTLEDRLSFRFLSVSTCADTPYFRYFLIVT
jgi:hypothetical protein